MTALCRHIEAAESPPTLTALAQRAGMSPFHLHRVFKAATGVTPKQYADAHRSRRLHASLGRAERVTDAIYGAGFNSSGRFYDQAPALLGMTPSRYRAGGERMRIRFAIGQCSLGSILVAASEHGVCAILLGDDPNALARDLQDRFPRAELIGGDAEFERMVARVVGLVEAPSDRPSTCRSTSAEPRSSSASGRRCARFPPAGPPATRRSRAGSVHRARSARSRTRSPRTRVAVAIPCHRVVRANGALAGYRWGVERKRTLLEREAAGA